MKNKFIIFYSIFVSIVYAFAISFFGFNVYSEFHKAKISADYSPSQLLISRTIKIAFLIILAATILTFIIIIFSKDESIDDKENNEVISNKSDDITQVNTENNLQESKVEEKIISDKKIPDISLDKSADEKELISENKELSVENNTSITTETKTDSPVNEEEKADTNNSAKTEVEKQQLPSEELKPVAMHPEGLFSPLTGFGWESYLLTRLDGELKRAISSESDIAVFVIRIPGLDKKSELTNKICNYLTLQFQFRDLLFEYKEDCFVAIKTNINLDEALNFADKLHFEISYILENSNYKCYFGISNRTIRIISGERLLNEAYEALKHAQEDDNNPIIAFRANAEKYLKLIQKQN